MHSSVEEAGRGHSSNGAAAPAAGAPADGASGPAYESLYNEPEDPTGTRQTLIQVCVCARACVHERALRHAAGCHCEIRRSRQGLCVCLCRWCPIVQACVSRCC